MFRKSINTSCMDLLHVSRTRKLCCSSVGEHKSLSSLATCQASPVCHTISCHGTRRISISHRCRSEVLMYASFYIPVSHSIVTRLVKLDTAFSSVNLSRLHRVTRWPTLRDSDKRREKSGKLEPRIVNLLASYRCNSYRAFLWLAWTNSREPVARFSSIEPRRRVFFDQWGGQCFCSMLCEIVARFSTIETGRFVVIFPFVSMHRRFCSHIRVWRAIVHRRPSAELLSAELEYTTRPSGESDGIRF